MNGLAYLAWLRITGNSETPSLKHLRRLLREGSPHLLRGAWGEGESGCVLEHLGRLHPLTSQSETPGICFAVNAKAIAFLRAWDRREISDAELLQAVEAELRRRRKLRKAVARAR